MKWGIGLISLLGIVFWVPPVYAQAKKPKKKPPSVKVGIAKANRILEGAIDPAAAKLMLLDAEVLAGKRSLLLALRQSETSPDGRFVLVGDVKIQRGQSTRYRTQAERDRLAKLYSQMKDAEAEHNATIRDLKEDVRTLRRAKNGKRRVLGRDEAKRSSRLKKELRAAEIAKRKVLKGHKDAIAAAGRVVNAAADERRALCELVTVSVTFTSKKAGTLDLSVLLKRKRVKLLGRVTDLEVGTEPAEIGGMLRVASVSMDVINVEKKLRKKLRKKP